MTKRRAEVKCGKAVDDDVALLLSVTVARRRNVTWTAHQRRLRTFRPVSSDAT